MRKTALRGIVVLLLLWRASAVAADGPGAEPEARLLAAAREIIAAAGYCALVTVDATGRPQARAMEPFAPDDDFVVWMATNPATRKVGEIRADPRVTLYYFDPAGPSYVTLLGRARLIDDPQEKAKRWREGWEAFYPNREEGYLLVEVTPERIEVVSVPHGIVGDEATWRPPAVELASDPSE